MRYRSLLLLICLPGGLFAQRMTAVDKPVIDTDALSHWDRLVGSPSISPFGRYIGFATAKGETVVPVLTIQDTSGLWKWEYPGVSSCLFSKDERRAIFRKADSLYLVSLGSQYADTVLSIRSFRCMTMDNVEWLAYQPKAPPGDLVLLNLADLHGRNLGPVEEYSFCGDALFLTRKDSSHYGFYRLSLATGKLNQLWSGDLNARLDNIRFDRSGDQVAFCVDGSLWYYNAKMDRATLQHIDSGWLFNGTAEFSGNGKWLFFQLQQREKPARSPTRTDTGAVMVEIWSYKDRFVQPEQRIRKQPAAETTWAAIDLSTNSIRLLEGGGQQLVLFPQRLPGDIAVVSLPDSNANPRPGAHERFTYPITYYAYHLQDGHRELITKDANYFLYPRCLSPGGRWLLYFDQKDLNYYSYDFFSRRTQNITRQIGTLWELDEPQGIIHEPADLIAGWITGDSAALIYDNYDLWAIDPEDKRPAINLTAKFGITHRIKFRIVEQPAWSYQTPVFRFGDTLLLTGFGRTNKYNGFFRQTIGRRARPELLTMGPFLYYRTPSQRSYNQCFDDGVAPDKASAANCWIVRRESATEAPNYYVTTDLRRYRPVTYLMPQANYNWVRSDLIQWRQPDGELNQGILYLPENFDSKKKYPVIVNIYEQLSHRLFEFPEPGLTQDVLNIPWFVSRGYLVFTPDIHFKPGNTSGMTTGEWAYQSVVPAITALSKLPYVDLRHLGIQGHSLGAGETNYLITHTHLFAAAAEAAGPTDAVSNYLSLLPDPDGDESRDNEFFIENGQERYGATPWERPDLYRKQSPVWDAGRVTAPLLIMHNRLDAGVSWRQGMELFLALRRLGKRVWWLQYKAGYHSLLGEDSLDYTIRLGQFFDYYLKGLPPPTWMTR
jgi:dienelactone hydrolase